jgi:hypothetical protein
MSVAFTHYVGINRHCCLAYYGMLPEYVTVLRMLRPQIEQQLPDVRIFISCCDEFLYLLAGEERTVPFSQMADRRNEFAYIREVTAGLDGAHPLVSLMRESGLTYRPTPITPRTGPCLICPDSGNPDRCYRQADRLRSLVRGRGLHPLVVAGDVHTACQNPDLRPSGADKYSVIDSAAWVVGTENEYTYEAIARGIPTSLLDTGGTNDLFRFVCPAGEIYRPG